ncbi:putative E3 ubiquitin-protein ligase XERICO [Ananas comosus]|uniref:Putative E3 ubiquitin-protein ligase XERICO n=1 Tax=Ananas comosus TaxID=4615 RepID=A0A199UM48_ANACO|nr:putative E3 ubiquitin-protein ligase XERICO [Ananas comosus]
MGLSSLPAPSEGVLTLVLVHTALSVSILKQILRSLLRFLRLRPFDAPPPPEEEFAAAAFGAGARWSSPEPSLTELFRSRFKPLRFGSAFGRRHPDCRVCLARFEPESVVNRLPCGHLFHKSCLETWLDYRHATCPLCRSLLLPASPTTPPPPPPLLLLPPPPLTSPGSKPSPPLSP